MAKVKDGDHTIEINIMVSGGALEMVERAITRALKDGGLHDKVTALLVDFVKEKTGYNVSGTIQVYNVNAEWEHYNPEHDQTTGA